MNFNDLKSYLIWRSEQRIIYKALSKKLRTLKAEIKAVMKAGGMAGTMQNSLIDLKGDARSQMEDRQTAKQIARDSWPQWRTNAQQEKAA